MFDFYYFVIFVLIYLCLAGIILINNFFKIKRLKEGIKIYENILENDINRLNNKIEYFTNQMNNSDILSEKYKRFEHYKQDCEKELIHAERVYKDFKFFKNVYIK